MLFATVDMHPSFPVYAVDLGPNVVLSVPNPADPATDCPAEHPETSRPFADPSPSCL